MTRQSPRRAPRSLSRALVPLFLVALAAVSPALAVADDDDRFDPRHATTAPPPADPDLDFTLSVWSLVGTNVVGAPAGAAEFEHVGLVAEAGVELGIGNRPDPSPGPQPVARLAIAIGLQHYDNPDDDLEAGHLGLNLLLGFGWNMDDDGGVVQVGVWLRTEWAFADLVLATGDPILAGAREGALAGLFVRMVIGIIDSFALPIGLYVGVSLGEGQRQLMAAIDLGGVLAIFASLVADHIR